MASHLNVQGIFAAATASDLSTALMWYECFLGRPADDHPLAQMAQWRNLRATGGLQLWVDKTRAGSGVMTIVVPDLAVEIQRLSAQGIVPDSEARGPFGAVASFFDADNNRIVLAEPAMD